MCGISGMYQRNGGQASLETVKELGLIMAHRGPDNFGLLQRGKVAMAHNRLSLLDLSDAANQPFSTDRYTLSYNGEIYNFKQIRDKLEREYNLEFKTTSDTEVLFYSLIYEGVDACLQQINGMFSFAFYDEVEDTLILARDRMGIKPLYYYEKDGAQNGMSMVDLLQQAFRLVKEKRGR